MPTKQSQPAKNSYADKLRAAMTQKAKNAKANGANPLEFSPDFGQVYRVRFLPVGEEELFYWTHSYHWVPDDSNDMKNSSGRYMWTRKKYTVDGKTKMCPFDEAVKTLYAEGRKTENDDLLSMGGILKRKRNFFCHVLLYGDDGPEYRVLVDRTNEGKLMRVVCKAMGIPFWRDVEDDWYEKESVPSEDEDIDYYDLLDLDVGHDFKIKKVKTGTHAWDISYADSVVVKNPRALTAEEKEILGQRVDLKTFIPYEEDYAIVKAELDRLIDGGPVTVEEEAVPEPITAKSVKPAGTAKKAVEVKETEDAPKVVEVKEDSDIDELLSELDDDTESK